MSSSAVHKLAQSRNPNLTAWTQGFAGDWSSWRGKIVAGSIQRASAENGAAQNEGQLENTFSRSKLSVAPVPEYPQALPKADSFQALQEWEGVVVAVGDDRFEAQLIDLTAGDNHPNEIAEILISDLQEEDLPRVREGAIFRWVIGYAVSASGRKTRGSKVYFRRTTRRQYCPTADLEFEP